MYLSRFQICKLLLALSFYLLSYPIWAAADDSDSADLLNEAFQKVDKNYTDFVFEHKDPKPQTGPKHNLTSCDCLATPNSNNCNSKPRLPMNDMGSIFIPQGHSKDCEHMKNILNTNRENINSDTVSQSNVDYVNFIKNLDQLATADEIQRQLRQGADRHKAYANKAEYDRYINNRYANLHKSSISTNFSSISSYKGSRLSTSDSRALRADQHKLNAPITHFNWDNSKCPQGKAWKVAVVQSGKSPYFSELFRHTVISLANLGLMHVVGDLDDPNFSIYSGNSFVRLARASAGGCIQFVVDGLYDLNWNWRSETVCSGDDQSRCLAFSPNALSRYLATHVLLNEVDMIWAFGSSAGRAITTQETAVPVVIFNTTIAASQQIVGLGEYSQRKNVFAIKDVYQETNDLEMLTKLIPFKHRRIGVMVDPNENNQQAQSLPKLEKRAKSLQIELVKCHGDVFGGNIQQANYDFASCMHYFETQELDAVFLTVGYRDHDIALYPLFEPLLKKGVFIFSQMGEMDVKQGAALSLVTQSYVEQSLYLANVINRIMHGEDPQKIPQYFHTPRKLIFNEESAQQIGWNPCFEVRIAFDQIFETIDRGEDKINVHPKHDMIYLDSSHSDP